MKRKNTFPKIRSFMAYHGETNQDIAKLLGISVVALSNRFNGKVEWSFREITLLKMHYGCEYGELL